MKCRHKLFFRGTPEEAARNGRTPVGRTVTRRPSARERGVALIITLIMLSVITFMAVTFLVLSRRERGSVTTTTDQTIARFASDAALERAKMEILAQIVTFTNDQNLDMIVSTNYISSGFRPRVGDPTNVNYSYANGNPLTGNDVLLNIANLLYNPRPPVYFLSNSVAPSNEFRFYRDDNRNGRFDTNGLGPVISNDPLNPYINATNLAAMPSLTTPGVTALSNHFVGDPEWIGILEYPGAPHSATNRFLQRIAFRVIPESKTLDVNHLHNEANHDPAIVAGDRFMRNQGVGTWDINFAAFLADLNTNMWNPIFNSYNYGIFPQGVGNVGAAFQDAASILNYRYNFLPLASAQGLFPNNAAHFLTDNIDEYSDGPLMLGATNIDEGQVPNRDVPALSWSGADNPNHFFTFSDFFDPNKTSVAFTNHLLSAGTNDNSYDRYTFSRLLAQLGTDSAVDRKINLNWKNVDTNGNIVPGMETNLIPWSNALDFFTNTAQAMFRQMNLRDTANNLITVTNIPLYPTNFYTPAVHRVLQLAANIYDAMTNRIDIAGQTNWFLPSVFRPYFRSDAGVVSIAGYLEETGVTNVTAPFLELTNVSTVVQASNGAANIFGVPWVIGAKKGLPNFNRFAMDPTVVFGRKLQLSRSDNAHIKVQQMFNLTISNEMTMEAWNSYMTPWPADRPLQMLATNEYMMRVVNRTNAPIVDLIAPTLYGFGTNISPIVSWRGYDFNNPMTSVIRPLLANYTILAGYAYHSAGPSFLPGTNYEDIVTTLTPQLYLVTTNRVRYALIDTRAQRVIDFVNLDDSGRIFDLTAAVTNGVACNVGTTDMPTNSMWCSIPISPPVTPSLPWSSFVGGQVLSQGLDNQLRVSMNLGTVHDWDSSPANPTNYSSTMTLQAWAMNSTDNGTNQTPYNPYYDVDFITDWQANDPLVHFMVPDLIETPPQATWTFLTAVENHHYHPWGGNPKNADPATDFLVTLKDPQTKTRRQAKAGSDNWDFPTNRFPNIGWLGRVHRGTPWQTVYLKSAAAPVAQWIQWSGHTNLWPNGTLADASLSHPTNDWLLFDLFTTAPNDNAALGQLSVNQTNLAAWSAVLSGAIVLTNQVNGTNFGPFPISPALTYSPSALPAVVQIVQSINTVRGAVVTNQTSTNDLFPNHVFHHAGDVLAASALTDTSPFLQLGNLGDGAFVSGVRTTAITDPVYERLPQQILSLLTVNHAPRFVVYSYGQTLHPADHSVVTGGTFNGLCTNYQVTAEYATRAVVRVEGSPDPRFTKQNPDPYGRVYPPHLVVEQFNVLPPD